MTTADQVRRALEQARAMLARETDPAKREFLQAQIQHLKFKLERAAHVARRGKMGARTEP